MKLSTDKWDSLLCARNIVLQTPHRFEAAARRSSMADFRRASLEFEQLAKVKTRTDAGLSVALIWIDVWVTARCGTVTSRSPRTHGRPFEYVLSSERPRSSGRFLM